MTNLTHLDDEGRARMVDVSAKSPTERAAIARGRLRCLPETLAQVLAGTAPKGSVIRTAELAGIMAAKRTAELIPLCHPLPLSKIAVRIEPDEALPGFQIEAEAKTVGVTGVEMEALTAASVACLTLFDMLKAVDRTMLVEGLQVVAKFGGQSGSWQR
ncbi:cyclic pyranopterin monophosphate synthase MoaC [Sphingomonas sp. GCM10030256]|uniref:cyclic pyranopterin monophosphate synthase MoaC n=1 Tax=Sphingomonas sp. GCM10030256 TaxID=3273427 RepID=UPI00360975CC